MEPGRSDLAVCVSQSVWYNGRIAASLFRFFCHVGYLRPLLSLGLRAVCGFDHVLLLRPLLDMYVQCLSYENKSEFINFKRSKQVILPPPLSSRENRHVQDIDNFFFCFSPPSFSKSLKPFPTLFLCIYFSHYDSTLRMGGLFWDA